MVVLQDATRHQYELVGDEERLEGLLEGFICLFSYSFNYISGKIRVIKALVNAY